MNFIIITKQKGQILIIIVIGKKLLRNGAPHFFQLGSNQTQKFQILFADFLVPAQGLLRIQWILVVFL